MLRRSKCLVFWLTSSLVYQAQIGCALPFIDSNPWIETINAGEPIWKRATFSSIVQGPAAQPKVSSPVSSPHVSSGGISSRTSTRSSSSSGSHSSSHSSSRSSSSTKSKPDISGIEHPDVQPVTVTTTIPPITTSSGSSGNSTIKPVTVTTTIPPNSSIADPPSSPTTTISQIVESEAVTQAEISSTMTQSSPQTSTQTTPQIPGMQTIDSPLVVIAQSIIITSALVITDSNGDADPTTIITTITTTTEITDTVTTTEKATVTGGQGISTTEVQLENGLATIIVVGQSPTTTTPAAAATTITPSAAGTTTTDPPAAASTTDPVTSTDTTETEAESAAPTTTAVSPPTVLTTPASAPSATTISGPIVQSSADIFPVFSSLTAVSATAAPTVTVTVTGSINTVLPSGGKITVIPFPNGTITQATISLAPTSIIGTSTVVQLTPISDNIFVPIATDAPPSYIPVKGNHPVQGVGVQGLGQTPIETNKFYTNLMVGDQTFNAFPYPYSVHWAKGTGGSKSWGLAIEHVEHSQIVFGSGSPPSYYVNPSGLDSIVLSASELGGGTTMTTDTHRAFSVNANLIPNGSNTPKITFPIVQGMGFVTGIYNDASVLIQSGISFKQLSPLTAVGATSRYLVLLADGHEWGIWITPSNGAAVGNLTLATNGITITGPTGFSGIIQVAKIENQGEEGTYDQHAGGYATGVNISANAQGEYSFSWSKSGDSSKTLVNWALPHHMQTLASQTASNVLNLTLDTLTAGTATAIAADEWFLQEDMPDGVGFEPWAPTTLNGSAVSFANLAASAQNLITKVATSELGQDINAQANLNTLYFSGKGFAKFAMVVYTAAGLLNNTNLANQGLAQLENAFSSFIQNKGQSTFAYDNVWKGIVDPAGYAGGASADFGNTYYNDHMFHYGYFVYTAAVIAYLDPNWLTQNSNKEFIDSLVRDYSNSVEDDPYFPFSRNFDWYRGHSWAGGLFPISDGKDLESTSEDTFASYAVKMWGKATGDANMEARGNLMLAVQARSLNNYVFMQNDNTVQPSQYIGNKVAGISFQNKMDHTTYFGSNIEYIEGIHMVPVAAHTGFIRPAAFISQEWTTYFDNGRVDAIDSGWKGVIYADYAFVNPKAAWNFFSQANFPNDWLDGGASQTWYLALAAMMGGAS